MVDAQTANKGDRIYQADVSDCAACPLKSQCTGAQRRYVSRHAHEEAFERMEQRMGRIRNDGQPKIHC